jgi:hypothetical protein
VLGEVQPRGGLHLLPDGDEGAAESQDEANLDRLGGAKVNDRSDGSGGSEEEPSSGEHSVIPQGWRQILGVACCRFQPIIDLLEPMITFGDRRESNEDSRGAR